MKIEKKACWREDKIKPRYTICLPKHLFICRLMRPFAVALLLRTDMFTIVTISSFSDRKQDEIYCSFDPLPFNTFSREKWQFNERVTYRWAWLFPTPFFGLKGFLLLSVKLRLRRYFLHRFYAREWFSWLSVSLTLYLSKVHQTNFSNPHGEKFS